MILDASSLQVELPIASLAALLAVVRSVRISNCTTIVSRIIAQQHQALIALERSFHWSAWLFAWWIRDALLYHLIKRRYLAVVLVSNVQMARFTVQQMTSQRLSLYQQTESLNVSMCDIQCHSLWIYVWKHISHRHFVSFNPIRDTYLMNNETFFVIVTITMVNIMPAL